MRQMRVEILRYVDDGEDEVVKTLGPMLESKAKKVEGGLNRNLDHEQYWTRQVETLPFNAEITGLSG